MFKLFCFLHFKVYLRNTNLDTVLIIILVHFWAINVINYILSYLINRDIISKSQCKHVVAPLIAFYATVSLKLSNYQILFLNILDLQNKYKYTDTTISILFSPAACTNLIEVYM